MDVIQGDTLSVLAAKLSAGEISVTEVAAYYDTQIRTLNPGHHVFISIRDKAELIAETVRLKSSSPQLPLRGIPVAIKDMIDLQGYATTGGTISLNRFAKDDAAIVKTLKQAGCLIMGKTNMHELAQGITGENIHFGTVTNPLDPQRIAGGSSSGSAAAVALGMVPAAVGSDTVGSIRIPAAFCGIYGLKPTKDVLDMEGCLPLSHTLDHLGFFSRSVSDLALLFQGIVPFATVGVREETPKIGVLHSFFHNLISEEMAEACLRFYDILKAQFGAQLEAVEIPYIESVREAGSRIVFRESWEEYGFLLDESAALGRDVAICLEMGKAVSLQHYREALSFREAFQEEVAGIFKRFDYLLMPAVPGVAPLVGARRIQINGMPMRIAEPLTTLNYPASFAGLPTLCIPYHLKSGLSVGFQLIAAAHRDMDLLARFS